MNQPEFKRKEEGLLFNFPYKYNEDGSINWRALVKPEHLAVNRQHFKGEVPTSIEGLRDDQLLIKLGGIKDLARLRGYEEVRYEVVFSDLERAVIKCGIKWIPNYENPTGCFYEDVANATVNNCFGFGVKFLETIAANRSFVRVVRNFLNIHVVGADEIGPPEDERSESKGSAPTEFSMPSSQSLLSKTAFESGVKDFQAFKTYLINAAKTNLYKNTESEKWGDWADIPAKEARILTSILRK